MGTGMRIKCPRCGRVWNVPQGTPEMDCTCHLFCSQGSKPSDCSVTQVQYSGTLKWPVGVHYGNSDRSDEDVTHITYYCSTHDEYYYKVPITVECDWSRWGSRRPKPWQRQPMPY